MVTIIIAKEILHFVFIICFQEKIVQDLSKLSKAEKIQVHVHV